MGRTHSWDFKLRVVNYAEVNGVKRAAKKFDLHSKSVQKWCSFKTVIKERSQSRIFTSDLKLNSLRFPEKNDACNVDGECSVDASNTRVESSGRYYYLKEEKNKVCKHHKCLREEIENDLFWWIIEQQKKNVFVTKSSIKVKATELFNTNYKDSQENFRVTHTWLHEFLKRKKLTLKSRSVKKIKPASNFLLKTDCYLNSSSKVKVQHKLGKVDIPKTSTLKSNSVVHDDLLTTVYCGGSKLRNIFETKTQKKKESEKHGKKTSEKDYVGEEMAKTSTLKSNSVVHDDLSTTVNHSGYKLRNISEPKPQNKKESEEYRTETSEEDCVSEEIENQLALWVIEQQSNNIPLTKVMVKVKILEFLKNERKENLNVSLSWVDGFLKRRKLNLKSIETAKTKTLVETKYRLKKCPFLVIIEQNPENISTQPVSDLNFENKKLHENSIGILPMKDTEINKKKTVSSPLHKSSKRKFSTQDSKSKRKKIASRALLNDYHFSNCTSNAVNKDKAPKNIIESSQILVSDLLNQYNVGKEKMSSYNLINKKVYGSPQNSSINVVNKNQVNDLSLNVTNHLLNKDLVSVNDSSLMSDVSNDNQVSLSDSSFMSNVSNDNQVLLNDTSLIVTSDLLNGAQVPVNDSSQNVMSNLLDGDHISVNDSSQNFMSDLSIEDEMLLKTRMFPTQSLISNVVKDEQVSIKMKELLSPNYKDKIPMKMHYGFVKNSLPSEEDQISLKTNESFPPNSQSSVKKEQPENVSPKKKTERTDFDQVAYPLSVQGLIARIAFQTYFDVKSHSR